MFGINRFGGFPNKGNHRCFFVPFLLYFFAGEVFFHSLPIELTRKCQSKLAVTKLARVNGDPCLMNLNPAVIQPGGPLQGRKPTKKGTCSEPVGGLLIRHQDCLGPSYSDHGDKHQSWVTGLKSRRSRLKGISKVLIAYPY